MADKRRGVFLTGAFGMWRALARQIATIVLIVAVATGFAVPMPQAAPHHGPVVVTAGMSMDGSPCAHDDGCPLDQGADMHSACSISCSGVTVLAPPPVIAYRSIAPVIVAPALDLAMVDHRIPPDPHPPK